jgi:5-(carboxyamino)imidazole ribonucleotide synthase
MRIGVIGGGQLGQMLGFAATDLGHECLFLDPADSPPAAIVGPVTRADFDDSEALDGLARQCDVVTYEFENVPVNALHGIAGQVPLYPPPDALRLAQDRLTEKELFARLAIPLPPYRTVGSRAGLDAAAADLGLPLVLKTRRFGYDGKGQVVVRSEGDLDAAWQALGEHSLIAEQWVPFDYEVSAIGVRSIGGETAYYCLTRNEHSEGILRTSRAPAADETLSSLAEDYLERLLSDLDYVGVLALELFVVGDGLLANEFAPRVHNSGHWTIEGAQTSQFRNHILAITDERPGPTEALGHAAMLNLIGELPPAAHQLPAGVLHDYGKAPRPGRKLGHVTVVAESPAARDQALAEVEAALAIKARE